MQTKVSLETIVCIALIIIGITAYMTIGLAETSASKFLLRQERSMGALDYQSLPKIYSIGLILLCSLNIVIGLVQKRKKQHVEEPCTTIKEQQPADASPARRIVFRTVATALLLILYSLLLPHLPFFISTAAFLFVLFILYGKNNIKICLPLSLAGAAGFWLVFIKIASLPIGIM